MGSPVPNNNLRLWLKNPTLGGIIGAMRGMRAALVFLLTLSGFVGFAQTSNPIPFQMLIQQPDHSDMPWSVFLTPPHPYLTFGQRYVTGIRVLVPAEVLKPTSQQKVLHFMMKVQDNSGKWLEGEEYNVVQQKYQPDMKFIECYMEVNLRPGKYTLAMIAYESTLRKANLARRKIIVKPIRNDPLPEIDAHLPVAEFPVRSETPAFVNFPPSDFSPAAYSPIVVKTTKAVRVDLVVNVFDQNFVKYRMYCELERNTDQDYTRCDPSPKDAQRVEMDRLFAKRELSETLSLASMISRFHLSNGCTFVTVVDPLQAKTVTQNEVADEVDWLQLKKTIETQRQGPTSPTVGDQAGPATFLHDALDAYPNLDTTCGGEPVEHHVMIVISWPMNMGKVNRSILLSNSGPGNLRYYYLRPSSVDKRYPPLPDDLAKTLSPMNPTLIEYSTPEDVRRGLGKLVSDIRKLGN